MVTAFLERADDRIDGATARSTGEGLDYPAGSSVDRVVSDCDAPSEDGLAFLERVRAEYGDLPFVPFTGKRTEEIQIEAISAGVTDHLRRATGRASTNCRPDGSRARSTGSAPSGSQNERRRFGAVFGVGVDGQRVRTRMVPSLVTPTVMGRFTSRPRTASPASSLTSFMSSGAVWFTFTPASSQAE